MARRRRLREGERMGSVVTLDEARRGEAHYYAERGINPPSPHWHPTRRYRP